jgi:5-methyltetrahydrofolate--homocysteine methyltransferase
MPLTLTGVRVIGERINPTGKKRFQQALLENDLDYILEVAVQQEDAGADILDVNVGYPGVNEVEMLPRVIKKLQSAVSLPLQLDSSNPDALEAGLRVYNGKAAVNSVNGEPDVMERVLPIVKKYGASVVGLALDKGGIPQSAEQRLAIARRILDRATALGIPREDVWIDCLTLTVSAQQDQAVETLRAVRAVREELGLQTVLGVSNISFGLPNRPLITQTFLVQAMGAGLTLPIINPNQKEMMDAVAAFRVLSGEDEQCRAYVDRFAGAPAAPKPVSSGEAELTLGDAIIRGLKADAGKLAKLALETEDELSLVENHLIPALDKVGVDYEKGKVFLPQLLSAAQAAQAVFEVIRASIAQKGGAPVKKGKLIVATVQGDIHDIGKNIVKTVLENYGYEAIDLGRDVPPEAVVAAVQKENVRLVGLSALMTTTLPAMEETIRQLRALPDPPVIFVGGAVVTPEYAKQMGADFYAKDARQSVEIARKVFASEPL